MATATYYRQCVLNRRIGGVTLRKVSWLPECHAAVGAVLKLRGPGGWEDGWVVDLVGPYRLPEDRALRQAREHLRHRDHSDI